MKPKNVKMVFAVICLFWVFWVGLPKVWTPRMASLITMLLCL